MGVAQGVGDELHGQVSRAIAYAASRYGHVLMPTNVHAPGLEVRPRPGPGPGPTHLSGVSSTPRASRCALPPGPTTPHVSGRARPRPSPDP